MQFHEWSFSKLLDLDDEALRDTFSILQGTPPALCGLPYNIDLHKKSSNSDYNHVPAHNIEKCADVIAKCFCKGGHGVIFWPT